MTRTNTTGHLSHLDGLRGLAAMLVIGEHYATALLPGPSPVSGLLSVVFDGAFAVALFFLLSGAVLTLSFARTAEDIAGNLRRRLVRLWLPVAAAGGIAYLLAAAMPTAHVEAARLTGSEAWLGSAKPVPSVLLWLREVFADSMLAGTRDSSLFACPWLRPLGDLFDAPVWSLHVELYGSVLVVGLSWLAARSARWHRIVALSLCGLLLPHPIVLILVGHLTAPWLRPGVRRFDALAVPLIAAGIVLAVLPQVEPFRWINDTLARVALVGLPHIYTTFTVQRMLGAALVYAGVIAGVRVQRALSAPLPRWLGRLSFSLYLIHFPILFTLTSLGVVMLHPWLPLWATLLVAAAAGLGVTVVAAIAFERWVDRPAMRLSRQVAGIRITTPAIRPA